MLFRITFANEQLNHLRQSIYNALYYLNDLEDKQTGVGYLETMIRYIFSVSQDLTEADVEQMIQQLESNHMKGSKLAMTLAKVWREAGPLQIML